MSEPQTVPPAWRRQVPSPELACKDNSHSDHQPSFITFFLSSWHDGPALHTQPALHMPSTSPAPRRSGNSILPAAASCELWRVKSSCRYFSQLVSCLMSSLSSLKRKCGNQRKKRKHYQNSPIIQIKIKLRVESDSWDHQFRVENLAKNRILFMNLLMDRGTH